MSFGKTMYQMLIAGSQAYAKWDLEVSTSILKNHKKMLFLLALAVPILIVCCAEAYDAHEMLGGKSAYAPAFYTTTIFLASIAVGLAAGLITGCIGAGGGFIIAPALMSAGVKGILAVGTDLFHIFAKAIMGSVLHRKLGNISVSLAVTFLVGSLVGAEHPQSRIRHLLCFPLLTTSRKPSRYPCGFTVDRMSRFLWSGEGVVNPEGFRGLIGALMRSSCRLPLLGLLATLPALHGNASAGPDQR